jgi:transcriptional regulator with XRE-family HTH domain
MEPAELVRSTREGLGLSQRELALRAGTTQAAISRIALVGRAAREDAWSAARKGV